MALRSVSLRQYACMYVCMHMCVCVFIHKQMQVIFLFAHAAFYYFNLAAPNPIPRHIYTDIAYAYI